MRKFRKIVVIEPVGLISSAVEALSNFAETVVMYEDIPQNDAEIARRIGDADAVLLSYTTNLGEAALKQCADVQYIGMCNSLYSPESANVDIHYANSRGITVTGIRDYGDEGVVEYVISELVRCLHGYETGTDGKKIAAWNGMSQEITGLKCGIVGMGKSGGMIADALKFFGAEVSYFSRTEKPEAAAKGFRFLPLKELLHENEVIFCCLNKNTVLLYEAEFEAFGNHKILFNTGLSPAWDEAAFARWIAQDNRCYCDTSIALGGEKWLTHPHVHCMETSSGRTRQAFGRLSEKVLHNLSEYNRRH